MSTWQWRAEFVRGALRYAVLAALSGADAHGYELLTRLTEHGLGGIKGGVLYPLLRRMEEDGLIAHDWNTGPHGPARKVYHLTAEGRKELGDARTAWRDVEKSLAWLMREDTNDRL